MHHHTCTSSHLSLTDTDADAAADEAELRKENKYRSVRAQGVDFRPIAIKKLDTFDLSTLEIIDLITERFCKRHGDLRARARLAAAYNPGMLPAYSTFNEINH